MFELALFSLQALPSAQLRLIRGKEEKTRNLNFFLSLYSFDFDYFWAMEQEKKLLFY